MRQSYRLFGIPLPYLPAGHAMGLLPLPAADPVAIAVGQPLPPPAHASPADLAKDPELLAATVDAQWRKYFVELSGLYYRHRDAFGYGGVRLVLDGLGVPSRG